jgi:hypothetical protein
MSTPPSSSRRQRLTRLEIPPALVTPNLLAILRSCTSPSSNLGASGGRNIRAPRNRGTEGPSRAESTRSA